MPAITDRDRWSADVDSTVINTDSLLVLREH